jgi:hypothetical protein
VRSGKQLLKGDQRLVSNRPTIVLSLGQKYPITSMRTILRRSRTEGYSAGRGNGSWERAVFVQTGRESLMDGPYGDTARRASWRNPSQQGPR